MNGTYSIPKMFNRTPINELAGCDTQSSDAILIPPEGVPQTLDNLSRSSPTVWFESVSQDQVVPAGRTLRITCQIHSKQTFGKLQLN